MSKALHKPLPQDVTLGVLLIILLLSAFVIVLPGLHSLRVAPQHYYYLLPVTQQSDMDHDNIPDNRDIDPYGLKRVSKAPAAVEVVDGEEASEEGESSEEEAAADSE